MGCVPVINVMIILVTGLSMGSITVREKGKDDSFVANSVFSTYTKRSVVTGPTSMTQSQFSDQVRQKFLL